MTKESGLVLRGASLAFNVSSSRLIESGIASNRVTTFSTDNLKFPNGGVNPTPLVRGSSAA